MNEIEKFLRSDVKSTTHVLKDLHSSSPTFGELEPEESAGALFLLRPIFPKNDFFLLASALYSAKEARRASLFLLLAAFLASSFLFASASLIAFSLSCFFLISSTVFFAFSNCSSVIPAIPVFSRILSKSSAALALRSLFWLPSKLKFFSKLSSLPKPPPFSSSLTAVALRVSHPSVAPSILAQGSVSNSPAWAAGCFGSLVPPAWATDLSLSLPSSVPGTVLFGSIGSAMSHSSSSKSILSDFYIDYTHINKVRQYIFIYFF